MKRIINVWMKLNIKTIQVKQVRQHTGRLHWRSRNPKQAQFKYSLIPNNKMKEKPEKLVSLL